MADIQSRLMVEQAINYIGPFARRRDRDGVVGRLTGRYVGIEHPYYASRLIDGARRLCRRDAGSDLHGEHHAGVGFG